MRDEQSATPRDWASDGLASRAHFLAWLGSGAQAARWALGSLPPDRQFLPVPEHLQQRVGAWPAARHIRHLALREQMVSLPLIQAALEPPTDVGDGLMAAFDELDSAWDPRDEDQVAQSWFRLLGEARFEQLRLVESASEQAWSGPAWDASPQNLHWLVARQYQHELEHLAAIWTLALNWAPSMRGAATEQLHLHSLDRAQEYTT